MLDRLMNLVPNGKGTYYSLLAGVLVSWLLVLFPDSGSFVGFEGGLSSEQAWTATWAALVGMFGRRAVK
jgi:hypothetical protein